MTDPDSTPDQLVAAYADRGVAVRLMVRSLDDGYQLLEGDRESLLFLSALIQAVANAGDCGFQISPSGPGSYWFAPNSPSGLYIHRTPCEHSGPVGD